VNCNKPNGFIEERIYDDVDYDAEELVNKVLAMSEKEVLEKQAGILGTFPNSYTFTKNLGERLISRRYSISSHSAFNYWGSYERPSLRMDRFERCCNGNILFSCTWNSSKSIRKYELRR